MLRPTLILLFLSFASYLFPASVQSDFDNIYRLHRNTDPETLLQMGRSYITRQVTDSSLAVFTILANRFDSSTDSVSRRYTIEARLSLGVINFLNSNYAAAYSNFLTATQLEGRADSPGHLNLAAIYLYFGDERRAYRCLRDVFDAAIKARNNYLASNAIINILTDDIDSSTLPPDSLENLIMTFRKRVPRTASDKAWPLADHLASASMATLRGNDLEAIRHLKLAVPDAASTLLPNRTYFSLFVELGRKYLGINRIDSAKHYLMKAHDIALANRYTEMLISVYTDLSNLYATSGRPDLAADYKYRHLQLRDSVFDAREFGKIHDLELFDRTDKFEKRINRMNMEEKMRSKILLTVCIALIAVVIFLSVLFRQNRNLRIKNKSLFEKNLEIMAAESEIAKSKASGDDDRKYNNSTLSDATRHEITEKINAVMQDEAVFCAEGFSLRDLAEKCGSNQKYVSQVLNEDFGKTFTQFLNERRINVARMRLLDREKYGHLTIEAIVADLGFKSRSTFSKTFKRITGLSPSEFQRMAADESADR